MIKRILSFSVLLLLMLSQNLLAGTGDLFELSATGTPVEASATLCLNGIGSLSCQNYPILASNISIRTVVKNHFYPHAGIRINTPEYRIGVSGCSSSDGRSCLFSVSDTMPSNIAIAPVEPTIGGTISGLLTDGLVLQNNGRDNLPVAAGSPSFQFTTPYGASYDVTVLTEPLGMVCSVTNGSGTATADVTNITVQCDQILYTTSYSSTATSGKIGTYNSRTGATINDSFILGLNRPVAITFDSVGNLYVSDSEAQTVSKYNSQTGLGGPIIAVGLNKPYGIAFNAVDHLYVANHGTGSPIVGLPESISRYYSNGTPINLYYILIPTPNNIVFDTSGNLYVSQASASGSVFKYPSASASGSTFISNSSVDDPNGIAFDASRHFYVANFDNGSGNTIGKYNSAGGVVSVPYITSPLSGPNGLAFDAAGDLFVAYRASSGTILKYNSDGSVNNTFTPISLPNPFAVALFNPIAP